MTRHLGLLVLASLLPRAIAVVKSCYTPNGVNRNYVFNVTDGVNYAACDNVSNHSMCCAIGSGKDNSTSDVCLPNGLCHNPGDELYWRESCTDPTWQDPACIKLFVNGTGYDGGPAVMDPGLGNDFAISDVSLTPCADGSFCYGEGASATRCCETGQGVFIHNGEQVNENPNATTTADNTATANNTTDATQINDGAGDSTGLGTGAAIGIGVVVGLAGAALMGAGVWLFLRRRASKSVPQVPPTFAEVDNSAGLHQLDSKAPPVELSSTREHTESELSAYRT